MPDDVDAPAKSSDVMAEWATRHGSRVYGEADLKVWPPTTNRTNETVQTEVINVHKCP